jgi:hypothetical protein
LTVRVAGVDLSLTGLALVAVPSDWGCDVRNVLTRTLSTDPSYGTVTRRMRDLSRDAAAWLEWARVTHVYLEQPIIARRQHNLDQAFRLGGMMELAVLELLDVSCVWAPLIKARTLFCGSIRKDVAQTALEGLLADEHQRDALVCANWGLSELGFPCLSARAA